MIRIDNISIRNKLVLIQVFTSLVVLSIFFMIFIITDIKNYKERKVKSVTGIAHVIGINSIPTLQFQDNEAARDILSELRDVAPEIRYAYITDDSGNVFAGYSRQDMDSSHTPNVLKGKTSQFTDEFLYVTDDIRIGNELIGKVSLELELTELKEIEKAKYSMAITLILASLVFSFVIAHVVQLYISRRLLNFVDTMKAVGQTGDYSIPIADKGKDEISSVIQVFNKLMQQVRENQQRKDEFIGIASHELKTPLTSVKGYLELLNIVEDRQPNKQCVDKALEGVDKLERLIKDLLDVSKIQSGQLQLNISGFDINALINETINSMQMVSADHKIVRADNLNSQIIFADRQRIEQVLINLLSNAIKYSPGENKVIVSAEKNSESLVIRVRDYGIGIEQEEMSDIFERFYRTKDSSIHISGFGLGLYICRDIVTRHKGKIWVEKENKGSSFYFSLPAESTLGENIYNTKYSEA
jgi:signal transduction histidine kinase